MRDQTKKVQFFSEDTQRLYQLYGDPPTLKISGVPMHRHVRIDPLQDTETKMKAAEPKGQVLDTCGGLGYTAIYEARRPEVDSVMTFEMDSNVIEMAKLNEYSKELFTNHKIILVKRDILDEINALPTVGFDTIVHDPPTFVISPDLYTLKFHKELFRILKKGGRLWHYSPAPGKISKKGSNLKERIMRQLRIVGFLKVRYDEESSGILAEK